MIGNKICFLNIVLEHLPMNQKIACSYLTGINSPFKL